MKRFINSIVFLNVLIGLCVCSHNPSQPNEEIQLDLSVAEQQLTTADNQFGLKLFKNLAADTDSNIFISPLSVSMALGMTYNGAAGETRAALHQTLAYGELTPAEINQSYQSLIKALSNLDSKVKFNIANSIWYKEEYEIKTEFIETNQHYFDAVVEALDFNSTGATDIINDWVSEETNGKIEELVQPPIDPLALMFLINAIYFKGNWTYQFDPKETQPETFYVPDGSESSCPMMSIKSDFDFFENNQLQIIELPYGKGTFNMTVILPRGHVQLDSLIQALDTATLEGWLAQLQQQTVNLRLPKFKLEYEQVLNQVLKDMGMAIAFSGKEADFSNMLDLTHIPLNLFISEVKHKSFLEVDEKGTEAAAATSVEMRFTSVPSEPYMIVDHPFIFTIREQQSGTILFIGKITNPQE